MSYRSDIDRLFERAFERDHDSFIESWMVQWEYQAWRQRRRVNYGEDLPSNFAVFNGPSDLIEWFNWQSNPNKPDYFDDSLIEPLVRLSRRQD